MSVYMQHAEMSRAREEGKETGRYVISLPLLISDGLNLLMGMHTSVSLEGKLDIEDDLISARRALRTASWAAIFYLITTDILGPFNAPFAFSQVGYVPGAVLYVVSE